MIKICLNCKKEFKTNRSKRKYCNVVCASKNPNSGFQKGHSVYEGTANTQFKKGQKAWNQGKLHKKIQGENHFRWKGGLPKCNTCGKQLSSYKSKYCNDCKGKIISEKVKGKNKGKHNSPATEFKKGQFCGDKHPNWVGGISKVKKYSRLMSNSQWRQLREKILKERGEICVRCKKYGNCMDHIIPWRVSQNNSEDNLQVLCRSCNSRKIQEDRKKWLWKKK